MDKLIKCRKQIDKIDSQIIKLYEKRMNIVKDVISFKIENGLSVEDKNREKAMIEKNIVKIKNQEFKDYYPYVLDGYLTASKKMQENISKKK